MPDSVLSALLLFLPDFHYPLAQPDHRSGHKPFHILLNFIQQVRYGKVLGAFFQTFFALHTHGCHCWLFRYKSAVLEKIHHCNSPSLFGLEPYQVDLVRTAQPHSRYIGSCPLRDKEVRIVLPLQPLVERE